MIDFGAQAPLRTTSIGDDDDDDNKKDIEETKDYDNYNKALIGHSLFTKNR